MINLHGEALRYLTRVVDLDARVANVITHADYVFDPKMTTDGGWQRGSRIVVNPHSADEHQRETLGHELAHMLDEVLFDGRGHGYGWAYWMRKLGLPVAQYHDNVELIMRHPGAVYEVACRDCGATFVRTFPARRCPDRGCESPDVLITRADGFTKGGLR